MVFHFWYDDTTDCSLGKLALGRGFELLRIFGLVRWGLGGSGHVEGTGEKLSFASQARQMSTGARDGLTSMSWHALSAVPQVHLLPSTSTVATVSEPQPPNPTSNDTPSITNTHQMKTMFTPYQRKQLSCC
ncbi:hypothetical protein TNCV_2165501 [Trichonephila clavipes]|nr:hypothetical protein TNCV_2165501 [Trichonephila clavipes]